METVQIVADRFGVTRDGRAFDLATGASVLLRIAVGGGATEQARWSIRCHWLHRMHHRRLASLVDYGSLGESQRFEAWRCGAEWQGAPTDAERTIRGAVWFLHSCNVTTGILSAADVYESDGRPVIVPPPGCGYLEESGEATTIAHVGALESLEDCGICTIDRRADVTLADLFTSLSGSRPYIVSLWGPPGSGLRTTALHAARLARLNGFVPIGVPAIGVNGINSDLLMSRHLCLISEGGTFTPGAALLRVALASPRIHVLLSVRRHEMVWPDASHVAALERIPVSRLTDAVRPHLLDPAARNRLARAARKAGGWPARFARLLWRSSYSARDLHQRPVRIYSRVAEQPSVYGEDKAVAVRPPGRPGESRCEWPAPGDLAVLRRRFEAAAELLRKGRHAPGIRQLRQVIGAFSRRGAWIDAADAVLALASALLARGDPRGSLALLEESKACTAGPGREAALVDMAVVSGHAWIDNGRLDEAESVIGTALTVARGIGDLARSAQLSLALGRCLFWKGRYAESAAALSAPRGDSVEPFLAVSLLAARARATVGMGDVADAMSLAGEATDEARRQNDLRLLARACSATAFVHLAVGDFDAVGDDVRKCLTAARAARDPTRAIRARVLLAESDRRRGRPSSSSSLVRRLRLYLPPIVRARVDLIHALLESPASAAEITARHAARTGLEALVLYGDNPKRGQRTRLFTDSCTEELVGILNLCQTADDESRVLGEVCVRTRRQLHAAAVAVVIRDRASLSLVAGDGARLDPAIAGRALDAGITVATHRVEDRLESAAPVRYGGATIGALAARWPLGNPYDLSVAAALLTTVATAIAPVVSGIMARRSSPTSALDEILGLTTPISDLRRAIERAAAAPFAVLIEGESGCGKELVAKAVHRSGPRRDRPFCTLNCAALPDDLVEAELFGHARGAFTGAINERAGIFEEANGGTLLLDEVGELSPRAQAKLLRVIQDGELRRIGENASRRVDVRIVSATNRELRREVAAGRFRLDLLYRLDVIRLVVPPLRERREDVAVLADHFWREATSRIGSRAVLAAATTAALSRYDWPGNVRELQNVLASLAVRTPRRGVVMPVALPPSFGAAQREEACRLAEARRIFEERFVRAALVRSGGHRGRAAAELGVTRQGLTKLIARLRID